MLSAIVASTGAGGTCTKPSVAARERDAVRERERRDGRDEPPHAAHEQQQREHERQMIHAEQNVLDAERHVGADDLERARPARQHDARLRRREPLIRGRAVEVVDAYEHVGLRVFEAIDS